MKCPNCNKEMEQTELREQASGSQDGYLLDIANRLRKIVPKNANGGQIDADSPAEKANRAQQARSVYGVALGSGAHDPQGRGACSGVLAIRLKQPPPLPRSVAVGAPQVRPLRCRTTLR